VIALQRASEWRSTLLGAFAAGALLLAYAGVSHAAQTVSLRWDQLPTALANQTIQVKSKSGATVKGRFASIDEQAIRIDTRKGAKSVSKADVAALRILDTKRFRGRAIGLGIGALIAVPTATIADGSAGQRAAAVPVYLGLGYLFGWLADRGSGSDIKLVP
jgi:hypothetical protein